MNLVQKKTDKILLGIVKNFNSTKSIQEQLLSINCNDLKFSSYPEWVSNIVGENDSEDPRYIQIKFNATENNTGENRSGIIYITYKDDTNSRAQLEITQLKKDETILNYTWQQLNYNKEFENTDTIEIKLGTSYFNRDSTYSNTTDCIFKLYDQNNNLVVIDSGNFKFTNDDDLDRILTIKRSYNSENAYEIQKISNDIYHNVIEFFTDTKILYNYNGNLISSINVIYQLLEPFNIFLLMKCKKSIDMQINYTILQDNYIIHDGVFNPDTKTNTRGYLIYTNKLFMAPYGITDEKVISILNNCYDKYVKNDDAYNLRMYLLPYVNSYNSDTVFGTQNLPTCIEVINIYDNAAAGLPFKQVEIDDNLYKFLYYSYNLTSNIPALIYTNLNQYS